MRNFLSTTSMRITIPNRKPLRSEYSGSWRLSEMSMATQFHYSCLIQNMRDKSKLKCGNMIGFGLLSRVIFPDYSFRGNLLPLSNHMMMDAFIFRSRRGMQRELLKLYSVFEG